jgi:hypothetical protein
VDRHQVSAHHFGIPLESLGNGNDPSLAGTGQVRQASAHEPHRAHTGHATITAKSTSGPTPRQRPTHGHARTIRRTRGKSQIDEDAGKLGEIDRIEWRQERNSRKRPSRRGGMLGVAHPRRR